MKLARTLCVAVAMLMAARATPAAAEQDIRLAEQDIKAALLYNFLLYTEWPPPQQSHVIVCAYGRDPFVARLAPMAGRTVNERPIEVRSVSAAADVNGCTLLFINASERTHWPELRAQLDRASVLTVSDFEGFAANGGMIEFARINNRIAVRINAPAVAAANLVIGDRLLRLVASSGGERR
ncbi:MAG TPA: YfiR family protein [Caulobacterales bacterium]|nr:YfiR family protein [Caulobacterales bacterium]